MPPHLSFCMSHPIRPPSIMAPGICFSVKVSSQDVFFVPGLFLVVAALLCASVTRAQQKRPHIIVILADDLVGTR